MRFNLNKKKRSSSVVSVLSSGVRGSVFDPPLAGDEMFGIRTCFASCHLQGCREHSSVPDVNRRPPMQVRTLRLSNMQCLCKT